MTVNEKNLFLLTLLPILITGSFLLWFITANPGINHFILAFVVLALLLIVSGLAYRRIRANFVDPIIQLQQQLDEASLALDPTRFHDGTLVQSLALTLQQNNRQLNKSHLDQMQSVTNANIQLRQLITDLESTHSNTELSLSQMKLSSQAELTYIKALTELCELPLSTNIGFINLLVDCEPEEIDYLTAEISQVSIQLVFLTRELQQFDYRDPVENFDIHTIVDEAITLVFPLLQSRGVSLLPIFDSQSRFQFEGRAAPMRALIFHLILSHLLYGHMDDDQTLILKINCIDQQRICFGLSPLTSTVLVQTPARFSELMSAFEATLDESLLYVPATATLLPCKRIPKGAVAFISAENYIQQRSLQSRLENLGVEVVENNRQADLYFIYATDHDDIVRLTKDLDSKTSVLLLNNTTLYHRPGWLQLKNPIDHAELISVIESTQAQLQHSVKRLLAVDDNNANLTLLTLLLTELGYEVTATDNPSDAISIAQKTDFDMIFLDLQMPGMTGMQVSKAIRKQGFDGAIIALTAHLSDAERQEILHCGMNGALLKPVNKVTLAQIVEHNITRTTEPDIPVKVFDEDLSLDRANQRQDLAAEFLTLLLDSLPADQEKLNLAYSSDQDEFRQLVHKINGALCYCGVPKLQSAIENLESSAKHEGTSARTKAALAIVNEEIQALQSWYLESGCPFEESITIKN